MNTSALIMKVWNYCHTLRDDGVSYADYLEQLTYLLFLKMAHEYSIGRHRIALNIPKRYNWASLVGKRGKELEAQYVSTLRELGRKSGMLGAIFLKAQNKIQDSEKLARLVQMIDSESWVRLGADTKGELYEGLLQKNAEDTKSGAGQYFTPRSLIQAMVECVRPEPMKTIGDPACGTGGFFLGVHAWLLGQKLNAKQMAFLKTKTFHGNEIVASTRRLCLMNLFLHGIGELDGHPSVNNADALIFEPTMKVDYVFANPPFGKKSSMTFTNAQGEDDVEALTYRRDDFWETTSNKQLNFLQHIVNMLKVGGKAAVVLPDNVLFEGGVGERIRRKLLQFCDVHTILRLPAGIFYANGVKANVVFFDAKPKSVKIHTDGIWFYDLRTNKNFTLKLRQLQSEDLRDFVSCYSSSDRSRRRETDRFRFYKYHELVSRDKASLDIFWLRDAAESGIDELPPPGFLQQEIIKHLEASLLAFRGVAAALKSDGAPNTAIKVAVSAKQNSLVARKEFAFREGVNLRGESAAQIKNKGKGRSPHRVGKK